MKHLLFIIVSVFLTTWSTAQVANYNFSESTGSAYDDITLSGATSIISGTFSNVANFNTAYPIGFSFAYNYIMYTEVYISDNGFIIFKSPIGTTAVPAVAVSSPISNPTVNTGVVAGYGVSLAGSAADLSDISYLTTGTPGNRIFTVQYKNLKRVNITSQNGLMNFQITLHEASNKIEVLYKDFTTTYVTQIKGEVGLRGSSNLDFNNRTNTNSNFTPSAAGTQANDGMITKWVNPTLWGPLPGTKFTWLPSDEYFSFPPYGSNGGIVSLSIVGHGFSDGTVVSLTRTGENDFIIPTGATHLTISRIRAVLDLHNPIALGFWNIKVSVPSQTPIILENAFEVKAPIPASIQTNIVGFGSIRPNTWQPYIISVNNNGNNDAGGIPLYIAVPPSVDFNIISDIYITDGSGNVIPNGEEPYLIPVDDLFDSPTPHNVYALMVDNIGAGESANVVVKMRTPSDNFSIKTWHGVPINAATALIPANIIPVWGECALSNFNNVMGVLPVQVSCPYGAITNAWAPVVDYAITGQKTGSMSNYLFNMGLAIEHCYQGVTNQVRLLKARAVFKEIFDLTKAIRDGIQNIGACYDLIWPMEKISQNDITVVTARDPNEKQGPPGIGANRYYQPKNIMPYVIRFENVATATAPAQTVIIEDVIDRSVFDLSTFQLGFISIQNHVVNVPSGLKHYQEDIDLRPENNIILRVSADLNVNTGVASWIFKSLDPLTMLETTDPLAGFLPPNGSNSEGEGAVMYSIKALSSVSDNILLKNKASIYFDTNPAIVTNEWFNTSDTQKPVSHMNSNPTIQSDGVTMNLSWTGSDSASGVDFYTIYYSTNGGPFGVLNNYVNGTSYAFTGEANTSYSFFTIATDNVGNTENMKTVGESEVTLGVEQNQAFGSIIIYPNPNQGEFNVSLYSKENTQAAIQITDLVGRIIHSDKQTLNIGRNNVKINLINDGVYILNLDDGNSSISKKIIIKN